MLAGFEHFHDLSMADKLKLVGEMWDDIFASGEPLPFGEELLAELDRRWQEIEQNPDATISEEELWRRVDQARG
jgi:putative addiction module component (TIGR02574 family)